MNNLYIVMAKKKKGKLVNFRVEEELKTDFETARELAGISKSEILLLYAHASAESRKRAVLIIDDF